MLTLQEQILKCNGWGKLAFWGANENERVYFTNTSEGGTCGLECYDGGYVRETRKYVLLH